jgi:SAM-dependent methyltransferase
MTDQVGGDRWSAYAQAYRESDAHRSGADLDLLVEWAEGRTALDVATGGGHVARRLREAGFDVVTVDPAPAMQADVLSSAEHIPFADGSFDVVVSRIAPHHFTDIRAAVTEMARVSRDLLLIVDNLYRGDAVEEAERLRDPTHVRNYAEADWRELLEQAGLETEAVELLETEIDLESWLARAGCEGEEAERVRALLADRIRGGRLAMTRIALKGRKR